MSKSCLVIGGGIAGVQAALDLADQGFKVYVAEKSPSIGGKMAQLDKTFPTLDCAACIMTPKMVDAARHGNIKLLTYSEVKEISGEAGNFKVKVIKKPRYVNEATCTGCGQCAQQCPIEAPNEFDEGLGIRKAIYVPFPQAVPLIYTIDKNYCIDCGLCQNVCGTKSVNYDQQPEEINLDVGAIVVATGFELFNASKKRSYGYGIYDNVITGLALERLLSASGPTGGHVLRPSDGKIAKRVAFVQCVGSRDAKSENLYCSRVCCMYAVKEAELVTEHVHGAEVTIFYMDIRAYGKGFEEFYQRSQKEFKINFVKGRVAEIVEAPQTKNLTLRAEDVETGEIVEKEVDLVVLSVGLVPPVNEELGKILKLPSGDDGFLVAAHPKTDPVSTPINGVFIAGVAEGPKDIPDAVTQASAAAMKASIILSKS